MKFMHVLSEEMHQFWNVKKMDLIVPYVLEGLGRGGEGRGIYEGRLKRSSVVFVPISLIYDTRFIDNINLISLGRGLIQQLGVQGWKGHHGFALPPWQA